MLKFGAFQTALLAFSLLSGSARAQERDPAAAQALFDAARDLMSKGHYTDACPKLVESQRLDPGIGTQFHLANCYEQSGKVASAWAMFLDVASVAGATGQRDREQAATARAARLEARLPKLTVVVPEASRKPDLEVRRDGVLVGPAQWGNAVPIDPGEHQLSVSASGKRPVSRTVEAREGEAMTFEVPVLTDEPETISAPVAAPAGVHTAPIATDAARPSQAEPAKAGSNALPLVLAGVGIVGIGIGTTFAILARSQNEDSKTDCQRDASNRCGAHGVELRNSAIRKGNAATIAFAAGGAALAGAGLTWLLGGSSSEAPATGLRAEAEVAVGEAAVFLKGRF